MSALSLALAGVLTLQVTGAKAEGQAPGAVVLLANADKTDPAAGDTLRAALSDANPLMRRAAARVISVAHPEAFDALRQALETESDTSVIAEFVKDIMALAGAKALPIVESAAKRAGAPAIVEIADWYARMDAREFVSRLAGWAQIPRSQDGLLRAIRIAIAIHPDARDSILKAWDSVANENARKNPQRKTSKSEGESVVQTPSPLAARLLSDTLTASGCRTGSSRFIVVGFAPDGRPNSIDVQRTDPDDRCRAFLVAIARVSTADSGDPVRHPHQLAIPLLANFFHCAADSAEPPLFDSEKAEGIQVPRLTREVKPSYTHEAMAAKLQGRVDLEAIVSAAGCVTSARVTHSLSGTLDVQGIVAVLQWGFEPARLEDRPITTYVSVDLTFTLK